jgi:signal transduction histidine kinase
MKPISKTSILDRQGKVLFVFLVFVGYIVTFAFIYIEYIRRITIRDEEIIVGILLGGVYLLLGLNQHWIYDHIPAGWADLLFFFLMCSLLFGIGLVLGVGGNVLLGIPLIGIAMERLNLWPRVLVYVALDAAVVLPLGLRFEDWSSALINGITLSVVILFIAWFAQLRLNEQQARERVEMLMVNLETANAQLAAYATQAEELAMIQERNRLAREIHDSLGHTLTIVNVQIEAAKVVMLSDPERALDSLNKAQKFARKGLTQVRESVASLRESPVSNQPLSEAIRPLVKEAHSTGIVTEFKIVGEPQTLENKVALALYRAAQEGLTNVCKHARASRVDILLDYQPNQVRLELKDNGVGATETTGGFGLLGIQERMQLLGGKLEIHTAAGKGFGLVASVPVSISDRPEKPEE